MSSLMVALEFVRTYLDDLLCITKTNLEDHFDKLKVVLTRLREAGLQINAQKLSFCAIETEYLGYTLTRTGIKPQQKKVQAILAISPSQNVKDIRKFPDMVQYYRDLWARHSKVLAPLTSLVGGCGHTKVNRANKTRKRPWYWDTVHQKAFDDVKSNCQGCSLSLSRLFKGIREYTDASSKHLDQLSPRSTALQKYSVTKLELLAIVETLKEFVGTKIESLYRQQKSDRGRARINL
eukprot:CCRYP_010953-RA/>CCRYP_010953-RA protein AED:0.44 eAED:0.41 QI:0/0/0/1/0/0/2/0/235